MADTERCRKCRYKYDNRVCGFCLDFNKYNPMTNSMKIRSMSDEIMSKELIPLLMEICEDGVPSEEWFLEWLKSEVKE